eukprot:362342-Chlamydomonas_euryale.AAC.16
MGSNDWGRLQIRTFDDGSRPAQPPTGPQRGRNAPRRFPSFKCIHPICELSIKGVGGEWSGVGHTVVGVRTVCCAPAGLGHTVVGVRTVCCAPAGVGHTVVGVRT